MGNESVTILRIFNGQFAVEKALPTGTEAERRQNFCEETTDRWSESAADSYPGI
jgi:hypothetical protein